MRGWIWRQVTGVRMGSSRAASWDWFFEVCEGPMEAMNIRYASAAVRREG